MTQQYLRTVELKIEGGKTFRYVGDENGGQGLRIRFETTQADRSTPNVLRAQVTNLADSSTQPAFYKGKTITLSAGYAGAVGVLFKGQIQQARNLRENTTDKVLSIIATDASQPRNYAIANQTLSAGHTHYDRVMVAANAFKAMGVSIGYIDKDALLPVKFNRGFAAFGMAKDLLRQTCTACKTSWSIQNGVFQVVKNDKPKPGGTIVLNSKTGLVGLPIQTIQGVEGTCLLNYNIVPTCSVQIDQKSIQQAEIDPSTTGAPNNALLEMYGIATDGQYKVFYVSHAGDTRGEEFYTHFVCVKASAGTVSPALAARGIAAPYAQ